MVNFETKQSDMIQIEGKTVADLVAEDYRTADVFKKNGIDFCCGGKVSVKEICERKQVSYDQIVNDIQNITKVNDPTLIQYSDWTLDKLVDYIVDKHHSYVKTNIPLILQYARKVASVHGQSSPETVEIYAKFEQISQELSGHMQKEELILFPHIKKLARVELNAESYVEPPFGTLQNPIDVMEAEHIQAGDLGEEIRRLSNSYTPPEYACNTFRVLYAKLKEFENDLHEHIHLENNILFPKAIAIEDKYQS